MLRYYNINTIFAVGRIAKSTFDFFNQTTCVVRTLKESRECRAGGRLSGETDELTWTFRFRKLATAYVAYYVTVKIRNRLFYPEFLLIQSKLVLVRGGQKKKMYTSAVPGCRVFRSSSDHHPRLKKIFQKKIIYYYINIIVIRENFVDSFVSLCKFINGVVVG